MWDSLCCQLLPPKLFAAFGRVRYDLGDGQVSGDAGKQHLRAQRNAAGPVPAGWLGTSGRALGALQLGAPGGRGAVPRLGFRKEPPLPSFRKEPWENFQFR